MLSSEQRSTLGALARIIVPLAYDGTQSQRADLATLVEARLDVAPAAQRDAFYQALSVLGVGLVRLIVGGRWSAWEALGPAERSDRFAAWGRSRIPLARTVFQGVRRLVLATYYTAPAGVSAAGALPPLYTRDASVPWEGPLAGAPVDGAVADAGVETEPPGGDGRPRGRPSSRSHPAPRPGSITIGADITGERHLTADVVIIGSGAGGAVAAAELAESGKEVVILEEGSWLDRGDFDGDEARLVPLLFAEQGMRTTDDLAVSLFQGGAVGGGTTVNWMIMLRTPDHVLDEWGRRFGLSALSPQALRPIFAQVEAAVHSRPVPDAAHSPSNRVLLDGAARLGWRATPAMINANGCVRAGSCSLGCSWDAKQDARITWLPRAFARGARLLANTRVQRVELRERATAGSAFPLKRVHASVFSPMPGQLSRIGGESGGRAVRHPVASLTVDAPVVVLAAGAIGTPSILARSGMDGGGVGRFLRLHPTTCVMGRYDRLMSPLVGIPLSAMCDEFVASFRNGYGFWIECPSLGPGLAAAAMSGFGATHRDAMAALSHTAPLIALTRDGSDPDRSNGDVRVDRRGRTHIRYRLGPSDADIVRGSLEAAARLHLASGALEATTLHTEPMRVRSERDLVALRTARVGPNELTLFSAHVNGTCRMGTNPALSGATPEGERHGVRGLYVCDGSLLPTALGVNPQETIMALATLVARGIAAR